MKENTHLYIYRSNFQSKKQFNAILTQNSVYREEIESLRVERNRFDNLYRKLDKELSNLRKEKGELIEKSTQSYDARWVSQYQPFLKQIHLYCSLESFEDSNFVQCKLFIQQARVHWGINNNQTCTCIGDE